MLRTDLVTYENSIKYGIVQFDLSKQDKNDSIALLGLGMYIKCSSSELILIILNHVCDVVLMSMKR